MSLTHTQLDKLSKNDLISYALEVQDKYNDSVDISNKLEKAIQDISSIQKVVQELKEQNTMLESTIAVSNAVNSQLVKRIEDLERQCNANSQYSRRECLEISGIPPSVNNDHLEEKVIEIFSTINVTVDSDRIEACHRLKNDRTIVKFSNRKDCIKVLKNRSLLKDVKKEDLGFSEDDAIFVNESLCPEYRFLFWKCRKLASVRKIYSYWTFNGTIKIKLSENGKIHAITHVSDLKALFPNENFSKDPVN